jgi:hypothetical protein
VSKRGDPLHLQVGIPSRHLQGITDSLGPKTRSLKPVRQWCPMTSMEGVCRCAV